MEQFESNNQSMSSQFVLFLSIKQIVTKFCAPIMGIYSNWRHNLSPTTKTVSDIIFYFVSDTNVTTNGINIIFLFFTFFWGLNSRILLIVLSFVNVFTKHKNNILKKVKNPINVMFGKYIGSVKIWLECRH